MNELQAETGSVPAVYNSSVFISTLRFLITSPGDSTETSFQIPIKRTQIETENTRFRVIFEHYHYRVGQDKRVGELPYSFSNICL